MSEDDKHLIICQVIVGMLSNVFQIYSCFWFYQKHQWQDAWTTMHSCRSSYTVNVGVCKKTALDDEVLFNPWKCD